MRQGFNNGILDIEGKFVGINLGADSCAEHECDIKTIQNAFGKPTDEMGLARRKVTRSNNGLVWVENHHFVTKPKKKDKPFQGFTFRSELKHSRGFPIGGLFTGWDDGSFGAMADNSHLTVKIQHLKQVFEAFASADIAIWRGGGGVFQNAGLCIAIASLLPASVTDMWQQKDEESAKLKAEFAATGIEAKLKAANKGYFSLMPRRDEDGSLMFWLNPYQQNVNNSGWYKLSDLEDWIAGKGRIPKTDKVKG